MTKVVTQNRFKSPVLWSSLISAILAFLVGAGIIDLGFSNNVEQLITLLFTVLAGFGILNSPTNKSGF